MKHTLCIILYAITGEYHGLPLVSTLLSNVIEIGISYLERRVETNGSPWYVSKMKPFLNIANYEVGIFPFLSLQFSIILHLDQ